jgi:hypothetical protein
MIGKRNQPHEISTLIVPPRLRPFNQQYLVASGSLDGWREGCEQLLWKKQPLTEREMLLKNFYTRAPAVRQASLHVLQQLGLPKGNFTQKVLQEPYDCPGPSGG